MSNIKLGWLATEIRKVWPNVYERPGWDTYTSPTTRTYEPVGLINHHTAGSSILYNYPEPPYWTAERLKDSCNITIRPDGRVDVVNAGYAYDSGMGSSQVLAAVMNDKPLPPLAGLTSNISANPHYIDIEVQHLGDGSWINPIQYKALIACNVAICRKMLWDPRYRVIMHRESAPDRKIDPRWDGFDNPGPGIRSDTYALLTIGEDMKRAFVNMAFDLFPEDVNGDRTYWYNLPDTDPGWTTHFGPAVKRGSDRLRGRILTQDQVVAEVIRRLTNG